MKKYLIGIISLLIFIGVWVGAQWAYITFFGVRRIPIAGEIHNWDTETNIPVIGAHQKYDFVLLGSSHARIFTRFHNHTRVEKILGMKFLNLAQGDERGFMLHQDVILDYFYHKGNTAQSIVYFIDPFVFYRSSLVGKINIYEYEPYKKDFYDLLKEHNVSQQVLAAYAKNDASYATPAKYDMYFQPRIDESMDSVDEQVLQDRINFLYHDGYDESYFKDVWAHVIEAVKYAKSQHSKVIVIVPTTLMPTQKEDARVYTLLEKGAAQGLFTYHNFSHAIKDPALYYDVDHLNTKGVELFTRDFLAPALKSK